MTLLQNLRMVWRSWDMGRTATDCRLEVNGSFAKRACAAMEGAVGFKELCGGVPNKVKKITDQFCKKEGEENLGHNLWAGRFLEEYDSGKIFCFCTRCGCTAVSMIRGLGKKRHGPDEG